MRILRNYIIRETFLPFILAISVLTSIFLLGSLVNLANLVINKGVSVATMGQVFFLFVPVLLGYTLPIACLVAVIIAFSRLSSDNEMLALQSCGIHLNRILFPLFVIGIIASLCSLILNSSIIPKAHHNQRKVLKNLGKSNPTALLEAGVFIRSFGNQILFIHKINGNKMQNITIYQPQGKGKPIRTIIAKRGEFTPVPGKDQVKLKLVDGTSDEPNLSNPDSFYKLNFDQYFMTLELGHKDRTVEKKPSGMTLTELKAEIENIQKRMRDPLRFKTEYLRKITWSFSPLFFVLLGFPLAVITNRREKSANIVIAIFFGAFYYLSSLGCEALSLKGIVSTPIIMWVPNIILGSIAVILNIKCVS